MIDNPVGPEEIACPTDEQFLELCLEKSPRPENEALLDHFRTCPDCRTKFRILLDVDSALRKDARRLRPLARASRREIRRELRPTGTARRRRAARWMAVAGSAAAILLAVVFRPGLLPREDGFSIRGESAEVVALPSGRILAPPLLFVWEPAAGGESYRYELIDEDLRLLSAQTTFNPWILLPAEVKPVLQSGRTYIWTVDAVNDEGIIIRRTVRHFEME